LVVANDQYGAIAAASAVASQDRSQCVCAILIEIVRWLVEQHELGVATEGSPAPQKLKLAAAQ
jgi:hypothetical protein